MRFGIEGVEARAKTRSASKYFFILLSATLTRPVISGKGSTPRLAAGHGHEPPMSTSNIIGKSRVLCCERMENRAQGSFEFMLMLGAVLLLVASVVVLIALTSQGLGASVSGQIDNVRDNVVVPGLVGTAAVFGFGRHARA